MQSLNRIKEKKNYKDFFFWKDFYYRNFFVLMWYGKICK
jgi:hypothetical protein